MPAHAHLFRGMEASDIKSLEAGPKRRDKLLICLMIHLVFNMHKPTYVMDMADLY